MLYTAVVTLHDTVRSAAHVEPVAIQWRTLKDASVLSSEIHTDVVFSNTGTHGEPPTVPDWMVTLVWVLAGVPVPTLNSALYPESPVPSVA